VPSRSKSQQRLFGAAYGGATFPEAQRLRDTMTTQQLKDFASTPQSFLPEHVSKPRAPRVKTPRVSSAAPKMPRVSASPSVSMPRVSSGGSHPARNLGAWLHKSRIK